MRHRLHDLIALLAGAAFPLSLSPFDWWPLALLVPVALFAATWSGSVWRTLWRFYLFNLGLFSAGASWIFVSVHQHGGASVSLATLLVVALVAAWSLVSLPLAFVYARFCRSGDMQKLLGFSGLWVLQEWFHGWFLTGFPWLFLGYGVMDTPLVNYAPWLGVFGVSLMTVLAVCTLYLALLRQSLTWTIPLVLIFVAGFGIGRIDLTRHDGVMSVSLVQGNVDQQTKWQPENRQPILERYRDASQDEWGRDLVVWPEAAITILHEWATDYLAQLDSLGKESGTSLVFGMPDRNAAGRFQNTLVALGEGEGHYIKRRLVPFGEYVPLENYLRGVITLLDLPMSRNQAGPENQPPLVVNGRLVSASICYEVVYPELVRTAVASPSILLTVSNDTWFGASIGPWQHLQMARMRALENGRSLVRATNNGVTAVVDYRGRLLASLPQFEPGVLRHDVELRTGDTAFHRLGSLPTLLLSLLLALAASFPGRFPGNPLTRWKPSGSEASPAPGVSGRMTTFRNWLKAATEINE